MGRTSKASKPEHCELRFCDAVRHSSRVWPKTATSEGTLQSYARWISQAEEELPAIPLRRRRKIKPFARGEVLFSLPQRHRFCQDESRAECCSEASKLLLQLPFDNPACPTCGWLQLTLRSLRAEQSVSQFRFPRPRTPLLG